MKKKTKMILAASGTGLSLIMGGVGVANADGTSPTTAKFMGSPRFGAGIGSQFNHVLSVLVAQGTITQAQSDAILKEAASERTARSATQTAERTAHEALIATTIGSDWPTILKRLEGGESLATIAGSRTGAVITALVNEMSARIDSGVTAGQITSAQATTMKANLQARVTAEVNGTERMGGMHNGPRGFGGSMRGHHGPGGFMGGTGTSTAPVAPPA
jgi:hypothetical protein